MTKAEAQEAERNSNAKRRKARCSAGNTGGGV